MLDSQKQPSAGTTEPSSLDWTESLPSPQRPTGLPERIVWEEPGSIRMDTSGWVRFPHGHQGLRHSHDFWELIVILSGHGSFRHQGMEVPCRPGSIFLVAPGETHQAAASSGDELSQLYLGFSFDADEDELANPLQGRIGEDSRLMDFLQSEVSRLNPGPGDRQPDGFRRQARFLPMICRVVLAMLERDGGQRGLSPHQSAVAKAKAYMAVNLRSRLNVRAMAREACLSAPYFGQVFLHETGMSPKAYLNSIRLDRARELLKNPALSIGEVADSVGIPDPAYFNRLFKKRFHLPPGKSRQARPEDP